MRKLDFKALAEAVNPKAPEGEEGLEAPETEILEDAADAADVPGPETFRKPVVKSWRRSRHEANPTVQMSVRMPEETYERFRELCQRERRTNGDMLSVMLDVYEKVRREAVKRGRQAAPLGG
jgi:hypothetical protein